MAKNGEVLDSFAKSAYEKYPKKAEFIKEQLEKIKLESNDSWNAGLSDVTTSFTVKDGAGPSAPTVTNPKNNVWTKSNIEIS